MNFSVSKHSKQIRPYAVCVLATVIFLASSAYAQEQVAALQDMTVYGKSLKASDIDIESQTAFVTVIERESFEGKVSTVAEVLKKEVGVQVRESGGLGSFSTVYIRGASAQQLNVYLDGVLLNNVVSGAVDLSRISLGQVESIEIFRGTPPIQLGHSAIGGAINIKTFAGKTNMNEISVGYGSFESKKIDLTTQHLFGNLSLNTAVGFLESDNDFEIIDDNRTQWYADDDFKSHRKNNDVSIGNGLLSLGYQFNDDQSLQARVQLHEKDQSIPDLYNSNNNDTYFETRLIQGQIQFADNVWWGHGSYSVEAFLAKSRDHYYDPKGNVGVGLQDEVAKTNTYGLTTNANRFYGQHLFSAAVTAKKDNYDNVNSFKLANRQDFVREALSLSLQDDIAFLSGNGLIVLGGRMLWIKDKGNIPASDNASQGKLAPIDLSDQMTSWHSGFKWTLADEWILKTNLSQAIRVPRLSERFGDRGLFKGNPELKEETAFNFDAGLDVEFERSRLGATVFSRWLDDAIVASYNSRRIGRFENISKGRVFGTELTANITVTHWLSLDARATLQKTENLSKDKDQHGKQLPGHYSAAHYLASQIQIGNVTSLFEYQFEQGAYYDSPNSSAIPQKHLLNFTIKWQPKIYKKSLIRLEVNNLLDESYEAFNGYPAPGLHYFLSFNQTF